MADPVRTDERILDAARRSFGTRGYEATSLDDLGQELRLAKQTILYWFPSKQTLLEAALARGIDELRGAIERALVRARPTENRLDLVLRTVFRFAVRRPELLGLLREVSRLEPGQSGQLIAGISPLLARAEAALAREMQAGTMRRSDPRHVLLFGYSIVLGVATDIEARRALGIDSSVASLARLRRDLFDFLRAALAPEAPAVV